MAPRISACVDVVSEPYTPLSTRSTRAPARASNRAVAAPAQRAPTTTASTFMNVSLRDARADHRPSDLIRDHPCIVSDAVDKTRVSPALKIQAEHVEPSNRGNPILVHDFAAKIENGNTQPRVRTSIACRPDHRIDALILQIKATGSAGREMRRLGEVLGRCRGDAICVDELIDPREDLGHFDVRCGGCRGEIIRKGHAVAVNVAYAAD